MQQQRQPDPYPPPPGGYPPQESPPPQGFPPQQGYYPPPQGYPPPPQGYYPPPQGYPPQQGFYPPPQGYYPPPQGYPPPQQGYPPQGYPPQQGGGYPPQQGGPPQQQQPSQGGRITRERIESLTEKEGSPFDRNVVGLLDPVRRIYPGNLSPDPDTFVLACDGGILRVYDRDSWCEIYTWESSARGDNGTSYWNGTGIATSCAQGQGWLEWFNMTDKKTRKVKVSSLGLDSCDAVAVMHTGKQAVLASTANVGLIDMETGRVIKKIERDINSSPRSIQAVPNHPNIAIQLDRNKGKISVWDLNSSESKPIKIIPGLGSYDTYGLHFNPTNPNEFIAGSYDSPTKVFDFNMGKALCSIPYPRHDSYAVCGNVVICGGQDARICLTEKPDEEVYSFSYGGGMNCVWMTTTSAIAVCGKQVVEYRYAK